MTKKEKNKVKIVQEKSQRAEKHVNLVMERLHKIKNKGHMCEENVKFRVDFDKSFTKKAEVTKERERILKYRKRGTNEKIRQEQERAKMVIRQNEKDLAERNKIIMRCLREKNISIVENKKALQTENDMKKEMQKLRRENQLFNFQREQAMKNDYKAQLIEQLLEKQQRGERIKERSKTAGISNVMNLTAI